MPAKTRDVIGFDLGHGESALARAPMESNAEPSMLEAVPGKKNITTAIGLDPQGNTLLGDEALGTAGVTECRVVFKSKASGPKVNLQAMKDFALECYRRLLHFGSIDKEGSHFYVGCPSGWIDSEVAEYERLFVSAGIPALTVARESRAALMNYKGRGRLTIPEIKEHHILIIDIGSSTTDFTISYRASDRPTDTGNELGASLIDEAILNHTTARHEKRTEIEAIFQKSPTHRNRCLILCRKAKEQCFSTNRYNDPQSNVGVGFEDLQGVASFIPLLNNPTLTEIVNQPLPKLEKSWPAEFLEKLLKIKETMQTKQNASPGILLLTGGASRMDFVQTICKEVFPEADFRRDDEPEFSIARGLARWGRVEFLTKNFLIEIEKFCTPVEAEDQSELSKLIDKHIPALIDPLVTTLTDALIEEAIKPGLRDWRNRKIKTLNDLQVHAEQLGKTWVQSPDADKTLVKVVTEWFEPIQKELNTKTQDFCRKYNIDVEALRLDQIYVPPNELPSGTPVDDRTFLDTVTTITAWVVTLLVTKIMIGVFATFFSEPVFGGIIGIMVGGVVALIGKEKADNMVREFDIPVWVRKKVMTDAKIKEICHDTDNRRKWENAIREALTAEETVGEVADQAIRAPRETLTNTIVNNVSRQLQDALRERADEARLLIR